MLQKTYLHSGWEFAEKSWPGGRHATIETGWLPAEVPGHVHLDLVRNGVIADPFVRMNELGCQWVDEKDWTYRTTFEWAPKDGCPKRVLRFEGLDTICTITLNGQQIAEHDNMFVPLEVDVSDRLREGENELLVEFQSAVRVGQARRAEYFAKEGLRDPVERFDERSFVRKAQYMFGWDWGPRLVSCGIWQPVCLLEYAARILEIDARWERIDEARSRLHLRTAVDGEAEVTHRLFGYGVASGTECSMDIEGAALWFPDDWTLGAYTLETSLSRQPLHVEPSGHPSGEDMRVGALDYRETSVGLVEVKLVREPDRWGESFEFEVNGEKLFAMGANWIPDHSFPSQVDKARLRDRLEKAKDMGFNMLRVWGGGLYESDAFYDLCDELGILVWQDFPFACAYYPDDEHWQAIVRHEAEVNVRRLRHHPCLALWCGNNENEEMFVNQWGGPDRQPPRYYGSNHYDHVLPSVVAEHDPGRSYIRTSPIGTPPEEKAVDAKRRGPNADGWGDQHNWDVWHGRGDWRHYTDSKGRFSSEYGFASSCSLSVWTKTLSAEDWNPHSPAVRWHDRTGKGHETFHGFVKLHYPEPVTLEDWVYYSQLNQRDALRHGVEHYRRSEFCAGSLIWQLNDCWPVQSWAILDSDGHYKALAYELRRLHDGVLLSIERQNERVRVWVTPTWEELAVEEVRLQAIHLSTGEVLRTWTGTRGLEANTRSTLAIEADVTGLPVPDTLLIASGLDTQDTWRLLAEPKQARFAAPAEIVVSTHEEGVLTLSLATPVVDLMLTSTGDPSPFHDNFLTSGPGVVKLRCPEPPETIEARSLAGIHPVRRTHGPIG